MNQRDRSQPKSTIESKVTQPPKSILDLLNPVYPDSRYWRKTITESGKIHWVPRLESESKDISHLGFPNHTHT